MAGSGVVAAFSIDVASLQPVQVGASTLTAAVVRVTVTFSGALSGQQTSTEMIDPAHLLPLGEEVSGSVTAGLVTVGTRYSASLESLVPT